MRVTREQIVKGLFNGEYCPGGCLDEESCRDCAANILNEYDAEAFMGATNWVRELIKEFVTNWNKQSSKKIPKLAAEELDEHIMQRRYNVLQVLRGNKQD